MNSEKIGFSLQDRLLIKYEQSGSLSVGLCIQSNKQAKFRLCIFEVGTWEFVTLNVPLSKIQHRMWGGSGCLQGDAKCKAHSLSSLKWYCSFNSSHFEEELLLLKQPVLFMQAWNSDGYPLPARWPHPLPKSSCAIRKLPLTVSNQQTTY